MKIIFFEGALEVLDYFCEQLRVAAENLGHETYVVNINDASTYSGEKFDSFAKSKDTFMFTFNQIGMLLSEGNHNYWDLNKIPVVDFIQDHPWNYYDALDSPIEQLYPIVLDRNHAVFIEKYFPWIRPSYFMPNGGTKDSIEIPYKDRDIDILYVGTCNIDPQIYPVVDILPDKGAEMFKYAISELLAHPDKTIESAIENYCENGDFVITIQDLKYIIEENAPYIMEKVRREYKLAVMRALEATGATIEIYGDNWEDPNHEWGSNIHIHNRVSSKECNKMMGRAKIGLNCMPWYKRGCSERVFNIMINGALCLTDKSEYLLERFVDGENIILYDLNNIELITDRVRNLLEDIDKSSKIAEQGMKIALKNDMWMNRMQEIIEYVQNSIIGG